MHTDSSLKVLEAVTVELGKSLRYFAEETCKHFATVETDNEYAARSRAATKCEATREAGTTGPSNLPAALPKPTSGKRAVVYNLITYKGHSLGDYADHIRRYGTTDSYNTQTVGFIYSELIKAHNGIDRVSFNIE